MSDSWSIKEGKKTLERIRQIKQEKELKMCTNVPKINKYILKGNRSPKEKTLRKASLVLERKKFQDIKNYII